jgi:hypothetical protein
VADTITVDGSSQGHVDEIAMDLDPLTELEASDEGVVAVHQRRRFRPVFLDHKQWYQRDPRLDREWKRVETLGPL